jgi:dsDNA-binding SOS-regulon protein
MPIIKGDPEALAAYLAKKKEALAKAKKAAPAKRGRRQSTPAGDDA